MIKQMIEQEIKNILTGESTVVSNESDINKMLIGKYFIVRTYSAGVFFGKLVMKEKDEVVMTECRRIYYWKTKGGISLSEVAKTGLSSESRVCAETSNHYLVAIELIECQDEAIESIKGMEDYVS